MGGGAKEQLHLVPTGPNQNQAKISSLQTGQEFFSFASSRCPWLGPARRHLEVKVFTTGSSLTEPPALTSTIKTMASSEKVAAVFIGSEIMESLKS